VRLNPESIDLATLRQLWSGAEASLDDASMLRVAASAASVERIVAGGETVYGINTGFGLLARTRIDDARLAELQRALVLSHSAGTGPLLDDAIVRLVVALKVASLGRGHSGVRWQVIETLVAMHDRGVVNIVEIPRLRKHRVRHGGGWRRQLEGSEQDG